MLELLYQREMMSRLCLAKWKEKKIKGREAKMFISFKCKFICIVRMGIIHNLFKETVRACAYGWTRYFLCLLYICMWILSLHHNVWFLSGLFIMVVKDIFFNVISFSQSKHTIVSFSMEMLNFKWILLICLLQMYTFIKDIIYLFLN